MKKIIVACGSGIATSGMVAAKLRNMLEDRGLRGKATVDSVDMKSLDLAIQSADIYISIAQVNPSKSYGIPTFNGVAFLTGVGQDAVLEEIIKAL